MLTTVGVADRPRDSISSTQGHLHLTNTPSHRPGRQVMPPYLVQLPAALIGRVAIPCAAPVMQNGSITMSGEMSLHA